MVKYLLLCFILIFTISCNKEDFETYHFFGLGTLIDITITEKESDKIPLIINYINQLSDNILRGENNINNALINEPVEISEDLAYIYKRALFYNNISKAYNPAIYTILNLYGFSEGPYKIPDNKSLKDAEKISYFNNLILNDNKIYKKENIKVDFSANAKGYVVDKTADYMKSLNIYNFILNIGGDLYVSGDKNSRLFNIGIKSPEKNVLNIVKLKNKAVATSGSYERYFTAYGKKYNHIFSGTNFLPDEKYISLSVIAENTETADGFATLFYLLDIDKIKKYCKMYNVAVLILTNERKTVKLCNWEQYE